MGFISEKFRGKTPARRVVRMSLGEQIVDGIKDDLREFAKKNKRRS